MEKYLKQYFFYSAVIYTITYWLYVLVVFFLIFVLWLGLF